MKTFTSLLLAVKAKLIGFQESDEFIFTETILKWTESELANYDFTSIGQETNFEKELNFDTHGWTLSVEAPPLAWIAAVIAAQKCGYNVSEYQNDFLYAVSYYGFYGLFEMMFPNVTVGTNEDSFEFYKLRAKYYRRQGRFDDAHSDHEKLLRYADTGELKSYAMTLLSKHYSDYMQRERLAFEYSTLAYDRTEPSKKTLSNRLIICIDTYAKEIRTDNPRKSKIIYNKLLRNLEHSSPRRILRIKFRMLELDIKNAIQERNIGKLNRLFQKYKRLIEENDGCDNPKADYIRTMHFIALIRMAKDALDFASIKGWLKNTIRQLGQDNDVEWILDDCIRNAKKFKDRRYIVMGYTEKAFWCDDHNRKLAILKEGSGYLMNNDEKYLHKTHIEFLEQLAFQCTVGEKPRLDDAWRYYQDLNTCLASLIEKLERDRNNIDKYLKRSQKVHSSQMPELNYLNRREIIRIKSALMFDYAELSKRLHRFVMAIYGIYQLQYLLLYHRNEMISHDIKHLSNDIYYVSESIGKTISSMPMGQKRNYILGKIEGIQGICSSISKILNTDVRDFDDLANMSGNNNLIKEIVQVLEQNIKYRGMEIIAQPYDLKGKIRIMQVKFLIENLVDNSRDVGIRNNIDNISIDMRLYRDTDGILYLDYSDNVGEFELFKNIIGKINTGDCFVPGNTSPHNQGKALLTLRSSFLRTGLIQEWKLSGDDSKKTLTIPIGK